MRELARSTRRSATAGPRRSPELPVQYADYAAWQRELARAARCCERSSPTGGGSSRGRPPVSSCPPTGRGPPVPTCAARGAASRLGRRAAARALRPSGAGEGATLFMMLLAAFEVLLHRYTGQRRRAWWARPIAGRTRAETEGLDRLLRQHPGAARRRVGRPDASASCSGACARGVPRRLRAPGPALRAAGGGAGAGARPRPHAALPGDVRAPERAARGRSSSRA